MSSHTSSKSRRKKRRGSWLERYVENRYKRAGYKTQRHVITSKGEIDIMITRGKEKYAVEVKSGRQKITSTIIKKIYDKARNSKAKPIMIISPTVKLTNPAKREAKKLKVRIKKIKIKK